MRVLACINKVPDLHRPLRWISSGTSVGALMGALAGGSLADKIGRKWVLGVGDACFVIGAIIICSGFSVAQVIAGRVVLGWGVGIAAAVAPLCKRKSGARP